MEHKIKVHIADDHKIFRDGIKSLLDKEKDIKVVAEASNGRQFLNKLDDKLLDKYEIKQPYFLYIGRLEKKKNTPGYQRWYRNTRRKPWEARSLKR